MHIFCTQHTLRYNFARLTKQKKLKICCHAKKKKTEAYRN